MTPSFKWALIVIAAIVALFATFAIVASIVAPVPPEQSAAAAAAPAVDERPENADVHARIAAMTDCAGLQAEFDQADANHATAVRFSRLHAMQWSTALMSAAHERMREIGCYDR